MGGRPAKLLVVFSLVLLSGCSSVVLFHPAGQIGQEEKRVILTTAALMLIVVVPVLVLTPLFAWRYRASGPKADRPRKRTPGALEIVIWLVPAGIVLALSILSWTMTHRLDPFRPLDSPKQPITVQVIALDWKWLFIYPDQQVAAVNEVAFPTDVPVRFLLTSDTVMNSFFIPQLGSQIYAMAGMQSELHLVASKPGTYAGISANISGHGFSGMQFTARATSGVEFDGWVSAARRSGRRMDMEEYRRLAEPSQNNPVEYFSLADSQLFSQIIGKYAFAH